MCTLRPEGRLPWVGQGRATAPVTEEEQPAVHGVGLPTGACLTAEPARGEKDIKMKDYVLSTQKDERDGHRNCRLLEGVLRAVPSSEP